MSRGFRLFSIFALILAGTAAHAADTEVYFQNGRKTFASIDADRDFCRMDAQAYRKHLSAPSRVVNLYFYEPLTGNFGDGEIHETRVHTEDGADIECVSDHKPVLDELAAIMGRDLRI